MCGSRCVDGRKGWTKQGFEENKSCRTKSAPFSRFPEDCRNLHIGSREQKEIACVPWYSAIKRWNYMYTCVYGYLQWPCRRSCSFRDCNPAPFFLPSMVTDCGTTIMPSTALMPRLLPLPKELDTSWGCPGGPSCPSL